MQHSTPTTTLQTILVPFQEPSHGSGKHLVFIEEWYPQLFVSRTTRISLENKHNFFASLLMGIMSTMLDTKINVTD